MFSCIANYLGGIYIGEFEAESYFEACKKMIESFRIVKIYGIGDYTINELLKYLIDDPESAISDLDGLNYTKQFFKVTRRSSICITIVKIYP